MKKYTIEMRGTTDDKCHNYDPLPLETAKDVAQQTDTEANKSLDKIIGEKVCKAST